MKVFVIIKTKWYGDDEIKEIVSICKDKESLNLNFRKQKDGVRKEIFDYHGSYKVNVDCEYEFMLTNKYGDEYSLSVEEHELI